MSDVLSKVAYAAGCAAARNSVFSKISAEDFTHHPPDDAPAAIPYGYGADARMRDAALNNIPDREPGTSPTRSLRSSDDFAAAVQEDGTEEILDGKKNKKETPGSIAERPVHWSGNTSLEGGDAAGRVTSIPMPRFGGV